MRLGLQAEGENKFLDPRRLLDEGCQAAGLLSAALPDSERSIASGTPMPVWILEC